MSLARIETLEKALETLSYSDTVLFGASAETEVVGKKLDPEQVLEGEFYPMIALTKEGLSLRATFSTKIPPIAKLSCDCAVNFRVTEPCTVRRDVLVAHANNIGLPLLVSYANSVLAPYIAHMRLQLERPFPPKEILGASAFSFTDMGDWIDLGA